jgi:hypothetical protein
MRLGLAKALSDYCDFHYAPGIPTLLLIRP